MSDIIIKKPDLNSADVNRNMAMVDTWIHDTADKINYRIATQDKAAEDTELRIAALRAYLDEALENANKESGSDSSGEGGEGTTDYNDLTNKPQIEGVTLSGNKYLSELNLKSLTNQELLLLLT